MPRRCLLVTGGCSGLGEAVVSVLSRDECNVAIFDCSGNEDHKSLGSRVRLWVVDVTEPSEVTAAVKEACSHFGGLTGVVNCAGVGAAGLTVGRDGEPLDPSTFEFCIKVNLFGTFLVGSTVAAAMTKQPERPEARGRGVIINIASVAGIEGQKGCVVGLCLPFRHNTRQRTCRA